MVAALHGCICPFPDGHSIFSPHNFYPSGKSGKKKTKKPQAGMGSDGVTVTKFLQLFMFWQLELSYFLSQIAVTVPEVTIVPKYFG